MEERNFAVFQGHRAEVRIGQIRLGAQVLMVIGSSVTYVLNHKCYRCSDHAPRPWATKSKIANSRIANNQTVYYEAIIRLVTNYVNL